MENPNFVPVKNQTKKTTCCCCKLNKITIAIIVLAIIVVVALIVGLTLYFTLNKKSSINSLDASKRVDCAPDKTSTISEAQCQQRGCVYSADTNGITGAPLCYYPPNYGYKVSKQEDQTIYLTAPQGLYQPFGSPILNLIMTYEYSLPTMLHLKISDADNQQRFQVPIKLNEPIGDSVTTNDSELLLVMGENDDFFNFQIRRNNSKTALIDTSIGGFVYSDQFIQLATYLPSFNVYGFGENTHQTLMHDLTQFKTWPMFSRDQAPESDKEVLGNLYGVHPFYMAIESDHQAHGVFILNSNAQEYTLGPGPSLAYRTIGGILDMYVFSGPTPLDVIRQYWSLIGYPLMPAYWSLGFQLSKYGYANLQEVEGVVNRTRNAGIPQDVQYIDIDYMDGDRDFTLNEEKFGQLPNYMAQNRQNGLKWIFIVDPAISVGDDSYETFTSGLEQNVYISWPNETYVPDLNANYTDTKNTIIMLGTVWPNNNTAFPDFFKNSTKQWWIDQVVQFHNLLEFDGLWIDMNEPSVFGTDSSDPWYWNDPQYPGKAKVPALQCPTDDRFDNPPYPTQGALYWNPDTPITDKTLCMIGIQGQSNEYLHYDVHSLYGWSETEPTLDGLHKATGKRGIVISRSTYASSGKHTGHWLGDNNSKFDDLRTSIIGMLEFGMFGFPYIGADICGFNGNTTEELCLRWMQLGAFYPFCRNHNGLGYIPQDPAQWPSVANASKIALNFRYRFLPYLYTLFHKAHTKGEMVVRPVFFDFPYDDQALNLNTQFMWGPAFLVAAVVSAGQTNTSVYFPAAEWYDVYMTYGQMYNGSSNMSMPAPWITALPTFVRGGHIVPGQQPALNTTFSRLNPFQLLIAMDQTNYSYGEMYWDDGESIDPENYAWFEFVFVTNETYSELSITMEIVGKQDTLNMPKYFNTLDLIGVLYPPPSLTLTVNGQNVPIGSVSVGWDSYRKTVHIEGDQFIPVGNATLSWSST